MVRVGKKKSGGGRKAKHYEAVNSDSENDHYNDDFDPNNPFGDDEIEKFHNNRDKILLKGVNGKKSSDYVESSEEEGVLAFDDSDDDDDAESEEYDEMDEEAKEEIDEKDGEEKLVGGSWGRNKSAYYSGNRIKNDEDAELEEEEAQLLQAKMMKELDSNDFGLDAFQAPSVADKRRLLKTSDELTAQRLAETHLGGEKLDEESVERVIKNLSKMSKKEKLDFLQQESPELFELVRDFKEKISELESKLLPVYRHIKQGNGFQPSMASEYIMNKTKLFLIYCAHLSFYFILKSKRITIENHPIVKNILQYRNLCKQIEKIDDKLESELNFIRGAIEAGTQLSFMKPETAKAKAKKSVRFREAASTSKAMQKTLTFDDEDEDEEAEADMEEKIDAQEDSEAAVQKRAINYEIEKNKGLTPKRPKSYRNPRVRNRLKARKAQIKHKSIVPKVRSQDKRYSGEATGIRTKVVRGVKIK